MPTVSTSLPAQSLVWQLLMSSTTSPVFLLVHISDIRCHLIPSLPRSCEREDFRGAAHRYDDSEDDLNVAGGAGAGSWARDGWQEQQHLLAHSLAPQQILDQQEDQMRVIIER